MPTDAERLTRLEVNMETTMQAVLRMDAKLDAWQAQYVPRAEIGEMFRSRDERLDGMESDFKHLRDEREQARMSLPQWLMALAAAASAVTSIIILAITLLH